MKFAMTLAAGAALFAAAPSLAQTVTPGVGARPGLSGTFYKVASGSTGFSINDTLTQLAGATPSGTFTATTLNYNGGDNSSIADFLGTDGSSYTGASNAGDLSDGILVFRGFFDAQAPGSFTFGTRHDDNVRLTIGGRTIISNGCCGTSSSTATFATAGLYAVEFIYANTNYQGGVGGAYVTLTSNAPGSFVQSAVPEPATWAMMLIGFGAIGFGLRRRARQQVRVTFA